MPEAEQASVGDSIEQAHSEFLSKFDGVIATEDPVAPKQDDSATPVEPTPSSNQSEKEVKETEQEKPSRNKDSDLESRIADDPELKDYLNRKLQSTRDKTIADLNKQAKLNQTALDVSSKNPAFVEDWNGLDQEARVAWMASQPEYQLLNSDASGQIAKAIASDLLDLLGADTDTLTPEMLAPEGRDLLREHLFSSKSFVKKLEKIKKEAYEAGQADARATDRSSTGRPLAGSGTARSSPTTLEEAGAALLEGLSRLGM